MAKLGLSNEAIDIYLGSLCVISIVTPKKTHYQTDGIIDAPSPEESSLFDFISRYGTWDDDRNLVVNSYKPLP
jgi:hypothetical protein